MHYSSLLKNVSELNFVADEKEADAMIKSVLGHIASRMKESTAKKFAADLPSELTLDKLRGHQENITNISLNQFIKDLSNQFKLPFDQVPKLIITILASIKSNLPEEHVIEWAEDLPMDWVRMIKNA